MAFVSSQKQLRQYREFGFLVGGVFLLFWAYRFFVHENQWWFLLAVAALLVLPALLIPRALSLPYTLWMRVAEKMGYVMNRVILSLFYFVVMTPIGFLMKLFKKRPLQLGFEETSKSYFTKKSLQTAARQRLMY